MLGLADLELAPATEPTQEERLWSLIDGELGRQHTPANPLPRPTLPDWGNPLFEPSRYKVMYGGRGAGRSWSVARALLDEGNRTRLRILCTRELQDSIKDSVHRLLADQIALLGLPYDVFQTEIRHRYNGTLFIFEGLRYNVDKIKSMEGVDKCWVEEAERVSDKSWSVLIPTIRKDGSEIWVTFNPDLEDDPVYQRFVVNTPPDTWLIKVNSWDNPWLPDVLRAERDHLYATDPDAAAHIWGGDVRQATDAQVLRGKWLVRAFEVPYETDSDGVVRYLWDGPYLGADFGFAQDPTTLVQLWIDDENTLYVRREAYKVGLDIDDIADHWERHVPGYAAHKVRGDSAEPATISYLRRHGVPRIEGVQKWPGSVRDGIRVLRSFNRIVIHTDCPHTVQEARSYSYKLDKRTGDVLPEIVDAHNHCIDPMRYALAPFIRQQSKKARPRVFYPGMKEAS